MDYTEIGRVFAEQFLPVVAVILAGVLSALAGVVLVKLRAWAGVKISQAQEDALTDAVLDAIDFAEEQAHKALKAADPTPDSESKLEQAVSHLRLEIERRGLPEMARDELVRAIEARIGGGRS